MKETKEMTAQHFEKLEQLRAYLRGLGRVAVAFSGGVDSAFLLKTAHYVLGDDAVAVTARASCFSGRENREAVEFCTRGHIRQLFVDLDVMQVKGFAENPPDRCYLCKRELLGRITDTAAQHGFSHVAEGSNMDDNGDYRPGLAAVRELGVLSPLQTAGLGKQEIRLLSKELGLPTWNKPSCACLASRFVYGELITEEKLRMVEQAEEFLSSLGFGQMRVRVHGTLARIEVLPEESAKILEKPLRESIAARLRDLGFSYVTLDLQGYRTGSMNEVLSQG